jgi:phenylalanyl-tRNA synthetase beta chain
MKIPLSWLQDFVEIDLPIEELAHRLTMAGLEIEEIRLVGLPKFNEIRDDNPDPRSDRETKISGLEWSRDKLVVAAILEVMPHPNADRLVLCRLQDGEREHTVLTGAPNLFPYKGLGKLKNPLKVAYAREGAQIFDGHQPGQVPTTLKRTKIRGVESYSMVCSEKELGISDEHEGVIILDDDAPVGVPLVDYMGDAVLDIAITPNIARNANVFGVAREVAAITKKPLRVSLDRWVEVLAEGDSIDDKATIEIQDAELNPRFVLGLIRDIQVGPSPYWVQRRLRLAGMRPINNVVDATNYAMWEIGEPLHAFDYDVLVNRAGGKPPKIITRTAFLGERLTTLDDVDRPLDDFTVLVCDSLGPLSIAGVMGGLESEVTSATHNVLLEGAAWNFINIRKTITSQRLQSEAAYRFSRGVHPAMAERGVKRGLELMRQIAGGVVEQGLVDNYPQPPQDPVVEITPTEVKRWLGIHLDLNEITELLERLEFRVEISGDTIRATTPDHRLDIGQGIVGIADLLEEIARIYGYERIPEIRMADILPPQLGNPDLAREERLRNVLASLGLQEIVTYRMTSPEREARLLPKSAEVKPDAYIKLANPLSSDRNVLRRNLINNMLEIVERNARIRERIALFEIGPVFNHTENSDLPDEIQKLAIVLSGPRTLPSWQDDRTEPMDFYDLKGVLQTVLSGLQAVDISFIPTQNPTYHPGKCAAVIIQGKHAGILGQLHPLIQEQYELPENAILVGEFDLDVILAAMPERYDIRSVPTFPPVLEDLAVVVDEAIPAERVAQVIHSAGGQMVSEIQLFDVFRGNQIGPGKKSLAYSLTYQDAQRTLTDQEVAKIRTRIIKKLEQELDAKLRS